MAVVPTVAVIGKAGRLVINASDLASYQAKGYKLEKGGSVSEAQTAEKKESENKTSDLIEKVETVRSNKALQDLCEENKIEIDLSELDSLKDRKAAVVKLLKG